MFYELTHVQTGLHCAVAQAEFGQELRRVKTSLSFKTQHSPYKCRVSWLVTTFGQKITSKGKTDEFVSDKTVEMAPKGQNKEEEVPYREIGTITYCRKPFDRQSEPNEGQRMKLIRKPESARHNAKSKLSCSKA